MIDRFEGRYDFLSNYYDREVAYKGIMFSNSEAAFQSQKDPARAEEFAELPPHQAKALGRQVTLRKDWEQVKDQVMYEVVLSKFIQNDDLRAKLLDTGDAKLIEGNHWNDNYWGVCNGVGLNKLGKILMEVREVLREIFEGVNDANH